MPNPFRGNSDAAEYVEYYASSSMEREAVRRLHDEGIQKKNEALKRVEAETYPTMPVKTRTQEQVDSYLQKVKEAEERKRIKMLTLEQELYGQPTTHFDPQKLKVHVKHMYDDQMRRWRLRQAKLAEIRGEKEPSPDQLKERDINKEREAKWRPVATSPKREDGKRTLTHQPAQPRAASEHARPMTSEELKAHKEYLSKLSKPFHQFQKVAVKPRDSFNLYCLKQSH